MNVNPRSAVEINPSPTKKHSRSFCMGAAAIGLVLAIFLIIAGLLAVGFYQVEQSARIVEVQYQPQTKVETFNLSASQLEIRQRDGEPHSFAILFYTVDDETGTPVEVRDETWTYFGLRKIYQFVNGELVGETPLPVDVLTSTKISCKPEQFTAGMTLDDIVSAINLKKYLEIPLEKELVPDSRLYYADRLTFALQAGKLRYIETLPVEEGSR